MRTAELPAMRIPLGLALDTRPTADQIRKRVEERLGIVLAADPTRRRWIDAASLPLQVEQGDLVALLYALDGGQQDLFMQRTGRAAGIASRLDLEQEASFVTARTVAQASARILNEVADISNHSNNVAAEIKGIESRRSIPTEELRRFLYWPQQSFEVFTPAGQVEFERRAVRKQYLEEPVEVELEALHWNPEHARMACRVKSVDRRVPLTGPLPGEVIELRVRSEDAWLAAAIAGAASFKWPIQLPLSACVSTCTLAVVGYEIATSEGHRQLARAVGQKLLDATQ